MQAERQNRVLKWGEEDLNERFLTVEEIITKRRQEAMRKQGLQLVQILRVSQISVSSVMCKGKTQGGSTVVNIYEGI